MGGSIFINPTTGNSWADEQVQRRHFDAAVKRVGLRHCTQKQTHHTFATICLMSGANPAWVARQLGHASSKMLFEVYSHWIEGADTGLERRKEEAWIGPQLGRKSSNDSKFPYENRGGEGGISNLRNPASSLAFEANAGKKLSFCDLEFGGRHSNFVPSSPRHGQAAGGTTALAISFPLAGAANSRSYCACRLIQNSGVVPNRRPRRNAMSPDGGFAATYQVDSTLRNMDVLGHGEPATYCPSTTCRSHDPLPLSPALG